MRGSTAATNGASTTVEKPQHEAVTICDFSNFVLSGEERPL